MTWYQDEGWTDAEPQRAPRPRRRTPTHDEIMHAIRCKTYHVRAIAEVLGEKRKHVPHTEWTPAEFKAVAARQAEMRQELGL